MGMDLVSMRVSKKYIDETLQGAGALKGEKGEPGVDGFSPSAKVEKAGDTATITIIDKDGTTSATIKDGQCDIGGEAELLDIRVKADGTTATSAGNAVREQVSELKSDLVNKIEFASRNKFIASAQWHHGSLSVDGNEVTHANRLVSDFIKISESNEYTLRVISGYSYMIQKYNSDKTRVDGEWWVEKDYKIDNAYYIRIAIKTTIDDGLVDLSIAEQSTVTKNLDVSAVTEYDNSFFNNKYVFKNSGDKSTDYGEARLTTDYINTTNHQGKVLKYGLYGLRDSKGVLNLISFFDAEKKYLSGKESYDSDFNTGEIIIPQNAAYMAFTTYITSSTKESYVRIIDTDVKPFLSEVVNSEMTKTEFVNAINSAFMQYASFVKAKAYSFITINASWEWSKIYEIINKNFRCNVVSTLNTFEENCRKINAQLTEKIYHFVDGRVDDSSEMRYSLNPNFSGDEPSVIVSDDGNTMYLYAHLKRIKTTDGVNWSEPEPVTLNGRATYLMHIGINYIDGIYYLIGCNSNSGGHLFLYSSTDGLNFNEVGIILKEHSTVCGDIVRDWGNSYLIKDYGSKKYYLYIEYVYSGVAWRIGILTADNLITENADGTVGNWMSESSPCITNPWTELDNRAIGTTPVGGGGIPAGAGNADFAKGEDNRPIKSDGKYYMYFHSTAQNKSNIMRAYSYNLKDWTVENVILDNRDTPTDGDDTSGNADHCIIEFKGRTYLFYTWNINTPNHEPCIKYMIDDRCMHDVLSVMP